MTTKIVGVRELKNQAPKLVRSAEKGEQFVITRHGKAVAVLGPPMATHAESPGRERLRIWEREREAFTRMTPKLIRKFRGRFVALQNGAIVDSDADPSVLFDRVARKVGGQVFFIGRVGEPEPILDMPGFSLA